jgi:hypothetical protein
MVILRREQCRNGGNGHPQKETTMYTVSDAYPQQGRCGSYVLSSPGQILEVTVVLSKNTMDVMFILSWARTEGGDHPQKGHIVGYGYLRQGHFRLWIYSTSTYCRLWIYFSRDTLLVIDLFSRDTF